MRAPLPEVPPIQAPQAAKTAPPLLTAFSVWQIVSFVLSVIFSPPAPQTSQLEFAITTAIIAVLAFPFIYFVWRGANWARLVTLYFTALFSPYYFVPAEVLGEFASTAPPLLHWADGALCIFTLVYLNLPAVKAHFKAPKPLK